MNLKYDINFLILIGIFFLSSCAKEDKIILDYSFKTALNSIHGADNFEQIKFNSNSNLDLGFYKGNIWIKFEIKNHDNYASYMVVNDDFFNRNYRFYKLDTISNELLKMSDVADLKKQDHRTYNYLKPNFEINLLPKEKATFFINTFSDGRIMQATPSLIKKEQYSSIMNQTNIVNIVFFFAIIILLLINLFNWSVFKNKIYYFYIIYILSSCLFYFVIEGYLNGIVDHHTVDHLVFLSIRIWIISVSIFSSKFLNLAETNPLFFKIVKRTMYIILGGTTIYQLVFYNSSIPNLHIMENIFGFIWIFLAIIMMIISIKKIPLQAKYYLIAFSFLVFFLIIGLFNSHLALLPGDPFSYFKVGMIIEFIGFTYFIFLIVKNNLIKAESLENELILSQLELSSVSNKLETSLDSINTESVIEKTDLLSIFKLLESTLSKEEEWPEFKSKFEELSPTFLTNLNKKHPTLSKSEIRLLILIRIGFTQKEVASILNIAPDSVKKAKQRVRKKLELTSSTKLTGYLLSFS